MTMVAAIFMAFLFLVSAAAAASASAAAPAASPSASASAAAAASPSASASTAAAAASPSASASREPPTTSSSSKSGTTTSTPLCAAECLYSDDRTLRQAFQAELGSHAYHDADCISELRDYMCKACNNKTTVDISSAFPLQCAAAAPSSTNSVRHDDLGSRTVCVQKASTQLYDGVVPLQDGSDRVLCWTRNGQIWLASVDVVNPAGIVLRVSDEPFIDLVSRVRGLGRLAGVAVHSTDLLFLSYYYTNVEGVWFLVVDRLPASSSWSEGGQEATLTRVFSMACPSGLLLDDDYYGGQILFRPNNADPFLYFVSGPAQTHGLVQAQMLRFAAGQDTPSATQVYASIAGVPRRCALDAERPQDVYCAIVEEDQEVVYLISDPMAPSSSVTPPSPTLVVAQQRPTMPSIVGGLLYRGYADNTLTGSFIYMYGSKFWASPIPGYSTAREIRVTCSSTTSPPCGGDFTAAVTSFGEDANKNALLLTTEGVYIVVGPTLCDGPAQSQAAADPASTNTTTTENLIVWIIGAIIATVTGLGGGYGAYKLVVNCCNKNNNYEGNAQVEIGSITGTVHVENNYFNV